MQFFGRFLLPLVAWLVVPLALLLFAQWPLREIVQAGSRQANDAAQILFSLYMAVAVYAASRAGVHLAARRLDAGAGGWRRVALAACLAPWALFTLWAAAPVVWGSLRQGERFAETLTPGYFTIKLALALLLVLVLADVLVQLARRKP